MSKGYVYVMTNEAMPGLVKVGFTDRDPEIRAKELESTGVPYPFDVEYQILVDNPYQIEQRAHHDLNEFKERKEWFCCTVSEAIASIKKSVTGDIYFESSPRKEYLQKARKIAEQQKEEQEKRLKQIEKEKKERTIAEEKRLEEKERDKREFKESVGKGVAWFLNMGSLYIMVLVPFAWWFLIKYGGYGEGGGNANPDGTINVESLISGAFTVAFLFLLVPIILFQTHIMPLFKNKK